MIESFFPFLTQRIVDLFVCQFQSDVFTWVNEFFITSSEVYDSLRQELLYSTFASFSFPHQIFSPFHDKFRYSSVIFPAFTSCPESDNEWFQDFVALCVPGRAFFTVQPEQPFLLVGGGSEDSFGQRELCVVNACFQPVSVQLPQGLRTIHYTILSTSVSYCQLTLTLVRLFPVSRSGIGERSPARQRRRLRAERNPRQLWRTRPSWRSWKRWRVRRRNGRKRLKNSRCASIMLKP